MGELLKYIGLWILMATFGENCDINMWFYNTTESSEWEGDPFKIHKYMSGGRFGKIATNL